MEKCDAASKLVSGLSNTSCNPGIITSWCNFHVFGIHFPKPTKSHVSRPAKFLASCNNLFRLGSSAVSNGN